jgi:competence ComEA-like helix-hairpin-helix protein
MKREKRSAPEAGRRGRIIADYFTFNRTEQRGILVLIIMLTGVIIANAVIPSATTMAPVDFTKFRQEVDGFEKAWNKGVYDDSVAARKQTRPHTPAFFVELNTADTFDLQRLRGIGPAFAKRIINYRARLGGFNYKEQLLEVFGMDSTRFLQLRPYLTINRDSIVKIDLNSVTFKTLMRHPYFPFEVTKQIILYRQQKGGYGSVGELLNIPGITDSLYSRMRVYLKVNP